MKNWQLTLLILFAGLATVGIFYFYFHVIKLQLAYIDVSEKCEGHLIANTFSTIDYEGVQGLDFDCYSDAYEGIQKEYPNNYWVARTTDLMHNMAGRYEEAKASKREVLRISKEKNKQDENWLRIAQFEPTYTVEVYEYNSPYKMDHVDETTSDVFFVIHIIDENRERLGDEFKYTNVDLNSTTEEYLMYRGGKYVSTLEVEDFPLPHEVMEAVKTDYASLIQATEE